MSVKYVPVQWNRWKWIYDAMMLAGMFAFLWSFLYFVPEFLTHERRVDTAIHRARAFGACAFVMLTVILAIGPLARLDTRFLPLLYNRRHFGVMTSLVALSHAYFVLNWYFAFSPTPKFEAVLSTNTAYGQLLGFPFEILGVFSLICLLILAATSHDFWLKYLGAPLWKGIHFLIYPAYAALVGHVALGAMQSQDGQVFAALLVLGGLGVAGLHVAAAWKERGRDARGEGVNWLDVGGAGSIDEGRAKIAVLPSGDRVAVFRHEDKLSAIANACAHQNGPLGEGRIIDCLVTCPWHGFQYDVTTGRSPAPFTEKIPTYALKVENGRIYVDPSANPPGTYVEPIPVTPLASETLA